MGFPKPMHVAKSRIQIFFMKKKELELQGSVGLCDQEMKEIRGGAVSPAPIWWAVLWSAVTNFGDIREGFSDGVNGKAPRY
jgi:hypothetical protein